MKKTVAVKTVDEYLATIPAEPRAALEKLRKTIRAAAPKAVEGISYGIPCYHHHGMLVGYAAFKGHCSFFPGTVLGAFAKDLKAYETSKGTIRFSAAKPLPAALVRRLVKARVEQNEARKSKSRPGSEKKRGLKK